MVSRTWFLTQRSDSIGTQEIRPFQPDQGVFTPEGEAPTPTGIGGQFGVEGRQGIDARRDQDRQGGRAETGAPEGRQ